MRLAHEGILVSAVEVLVATSGVVAAVVAAAVAVVVEVAALFQALNPNPKPIYHNREAGGVYGIILRRQL